MQASDVRTALLHLMDTQLVLASLDGLLFLLWCLERCRKFLVCRLNSPDLPRILRNRAVRRKLARSCNVHE